MWSYYGSKTNIVKYYPMPKHDLIIEPFAGAAKYSLKYFDRDVLLVDKYEVIIKIWKWLQKCSPADILALPRHLKPNQALTDFNFDCEEAAMLMGFLIGFGMERPRITASKKRMVERPNLINYSLIRISKELFKIKHWRFECADYTTIPNQTASWFIDPPYQTGGHSYPHNNSKINFLELANWSMERVGQVIVCESSTAKWLDFKPFAKQKCRNGIRKESIWTNDNSYNSIQQSLFIND